jgi:hypothetical protein
MILLFRHQQAFPQATSQIISLDLTPDDEGRIPCDVCGKRFKERGMYEYPQKSTQKIEHFFPN